MELLELYYGETKRGLEEIAKKYSLSFEECQAEWQRLTTISQKFKSLPEHEASQLSINKIKVHACEKAAQMRKRPFWQAFLKPVYGLSVVLVAGVFSLYAWHMHYQPHKTTVANTVTHFPKNPVASMVKKRLFSTPFDKTPFSSTYRMPKRSRFLTNGVSSASVGNSSQDFFIDDELEYKIANNSLNAQDLETLFFRARKLEKLGYYQDALHDYLFLAKFYPSFENQKVIPLAVARCYEKLGDKNSAISVLKSYQETYGKSHDIDFWIDQLKSETF